MKLCRGEQKRVILVLPLCIDSLWQVFGKCQIRPKLEMNSQRTVEYEPHRYVILRTVSSRINVNRFIYMTGNVVLQSGAINGAT